MFHCINVQEEEWQEYMRRKRKEAWKRQQEDAEKERISVLRKEAAAKRWVPVPDQVDSEGDGCISIGICFKNNTFLMNS